METKARRERARERPLCKRKVAGAIPPGPFPYYWFPAITEINKGFG